MTTADARTLVLRCLAEIAPDADPAVLAPDADLRQALELDSMDVLNLVAAIAEETGIEIPDRDVAHLTTLEAFAEFVAHAETAR